MLHWVTIFGIVMLFLQKKFYYSNCLYHSQNTSKVCGLLVPVEYPLHMEGFHVKILINLMLVFVIYNTCYTFFTIYLIQIALFLSIKDKIEQTTEILEEVEKQQHGGGEKLKFCIWNYQEIIWSVLYVTFVV